MIKRKRIIAKLIMLAILMNSVTIFSAYGYEKMEMEDRSIQNTDDFEIDEQSVFLENNIDSILDYEKEENKIETEFDEKTDTIIGDNNLENKTNIENNIDFILGYEKEENKTETEFEENTDAIIKYNNFKFNKDTRTIISYDQTKNETEIEIPSRINNVNVEYIGEEAFLKCSSLKKIVIPETVKSIGNSAFLGCSNLESINIPNSVSNLGRKAFYECISLKTITIPGRIPYIGSEAFYKCSSLEEVKIGDGVQVIGSAAFLNCTSLESINIPQTVKRIDRYAFYGCINLEKVELPDELESLSESAFSHCAALKSITIPSKIEEINKEVFKNCTSLESVTILGDITKIDDQAFALCEKLYDINLPESLESIGDMAFFVCRQLDNIKLPKTIESIGEKAFGSCKELKEITIPDSVLYIGDYAFQFCGNISKMIILGNPELKEKPFRDIRSKTSPKDVMFYVLNQDFKLKLEEHMKDYKYGDNFESGDDYNYKYEIKPIMSLDTTSLNMRTGEVKELNVEIAEELVNKNEINWRSSDEKIISVTKGEGSKGIVKGVGSGKAVVSVISNDDNFILRCSVNVADEEDNDTSEKPGIDNDKEDIDDDNENVGNDEKTINVKFNANAGRANVTNIPDNREMLLGENLSKLQGPTRRGYRFSGWYTKASGGDRVEVINEELIQKSDITLYARWVKRKSSSGSSNTVFDSENDSIVDNNAEQFTAGISESKNKYGWVQNSDKTWSYYNENGKQVCSQWLRYNNDWYYMDEYGIMKTGWYKYNDGKWYYLEQSGRMLTGWINYNNKWYYLNENGDMESNSWKLINNQWFYFYSNGEMAASTVIDGYMVDFNGVYIQLL